MRRAVPPFPIAPEKTFPFLSQLWFSFSYFFLVIPLSKDMEHHLSQLADFRIAALVLYYLDDTRLAAGLPQVLARPRYVRHLPSAWTVYLQLESR